MGPGICLKLMISAAKLKYISEKVICIDSTGGMDRSSGHLFNLVIPGPTGGLSIGMFVVFSENTNDISIGLNLLKQIWSDNGLTLNPRTFMSDDCAAQISAINNCFPNSTVLLCQFHVVQALWRWLQSNALKDERKPIVKLFRKAMYGKNF